MGCPVDTTGDYDAGFADGFARDDYYWQGYDDSYDTIDAGPIYYTGGDIPAPVSPPYDAGYYDGLWYAYNDGYFVEYDYAFTIGFSEGYDLGHNSLWPVFLAADHHVEYLDGGFSDGYNDGFSEGRVFGAYDFDHSIAFDWLGAMMDYRSGVDVSVGGYETGDGGVVDLYIYGTDPNTLVKSKRGASDKLGMTVRYLGPEKSVPALSYRSLPTAEQTKFDVTPTQSSRYTGRNLTLLSSWLDRVNAYQAELKK